MKNFYENTCSGRASDGFDASEYWLDSSLLDEPEADYSSEDGAEARFANIMFDCIFKSIFGVEAGEETLIELLECLLPEKKIISLQYINTENIPFVHGDKKTVFDIYCKDGNGERFIVEMQLCKQDYFFDRSLFYSTYPIRDQLITELEKDRQLTEEARMRIKSYRLASVYVVAVLNFTLDEETEGDLREGLVSSYSLRNDLSGRQMSNKLKFVYLQIPRLPYGRDECGRCESLLQKIAFAFKHMSFLRTRPIELSERIFNRMFETANLGTMTNEERKQYDYEMTTEIDRIAQLEYARKERTMEIAKAMKSKGLPVADIAEITGVPIDEVESM